MRRLPQVLINVRVPQDFDWAEVRQMLQSKGVCTAAWATLRWTQLLSGSRAPSELQDMLDEKGVARHKSALA